MTSDPTSPTTLIYPEPPPELRGRPTLKALKYFGAGAIIASVTIGSGETFFASQGGALFGYGLLWCFAGGAIMKGIQVYTAARHMTLTGQHPMTHWMYLPGPRGWVPATIGLLSIACFPFWLSGLPLMIGKMLNWITGVSGSEHELLLFARGWGTICIVIAVTLTWLQSYQVLERMQTFIVGILLVSMLAACFASRPDWLAALTGFLPSLPDYDAWVLKQYDLIAKTPPWVKVGVYLGAIGGGTYDYIGYLGCFREKSWGALGLRKRTVAAMASAPAAPAAEAHDLYDPDDDLPIDTRPDNIARARSWLWPAKIDVGIAFSCVFLFTICFVILGAAILQPAKLVPSRNQLLSHQAKFLTQFHPTLLYLYQLGIFMAFWGTIYGAYEIYIRTAYECLMPLSRRLRTMPVRHFRAAVLAYCGLGGLALLWLTEDAEVIIQPAAILGGVFTCGLWCFAMLWTDRRFLPKPLRMGKTLAALTWISGIVLTGLGTLAIYNYVKVLVT